MIARRFLLTLALAGMLPGCGFRPMYAARGDGTMGPAETGLAEINIGLIPERPGQELRQALQDRFERAGSNLAQRYDLAVTFAISSDAISIQSDSNATRIRLFGVANWTLRAQDLQRSTLATGTARALDGLDILDNQGFAATQTNDVVIGRIAKAVADQIAVQLAAYFDRHPNLVASDG